MKFVQKKDQLEKEAQRREIIQSLSSIMNKVAKSPVRPYLRNKAVDAVYELYVYSLIAKAIKNFADNNEVLLYTYESPGMVIPATRFIARGAPGHISTYGLSFVEFSYRGVSYEVHLDIEFIGASGVEHEIDISIIEKNKAEKYRLNNKMADSSSLKVAFECKYYSIKLDKSLIRTFMGVLEDMGHVNLSGFASNLYSSNIEQYCNYGGKKRPYFLSELYPSNKNKEIQWINHLEIELKKLL